MASVEVKPELLLAVVSEVAKVFCMDVDELDATWNATWKRESAPNVWAKLPDGEEYNVECGEELTTLTLRIRLVPGGQNPRK